MILLYYCAANLGSVYYEQVNLDMAILHYKRAIACDAGFLEAYNNLVGPSLLFLNNVFFVHVLQILSPVVS